jgi:hypothetical protein
MQPAYQPYDDAQHAITVAFALHRERRRNASMRRLLCAQGIYSALVTAAAVIYYLTH